MAKVKKRRNWPYFLLMILYAAAVLGAVYYGLQKLYNYLDVYERSRPLKAIDGYMANLTPQYIADHCSDLIDTVDHNIQTEEECKKAMLEALSGTFTYAKKVTECTDSKQVFAIRCGNQVVGSVQIEQQEALGYDNYTWEVTGDSFNLDYLITDTVSAFVPASYTVLVNGHPLDARYQAESGIRFQEFAFFYDLLELPTMAKYAAGPCLGRIELTVLDDHGNPATPDLEPVEYLNNCSEEELGALDQILTDYLTSYTAFSSHKNKDSNKNFADLCKYMVPGGDLENRMRNSISGLSWIDDRKAKMIGYEASLLTNIGGGRYFCNITYTFSTTTTEGYETLSSDLYLVFLETEDGLKAEIMRVQ